jgi:hypothetical protein
MPVCFVESWCREWCPGYAVMNYDINVEVDSPGSRGNDDALAPDATAPGA